MADVTGIKNRIVETIYPNSTGAITADKHQQLLLELVDSINSAKEDKISDLATIRAGAAKGATALQEHQDLSHLATKDEVADFITEDEVDRLIEGKQDKIADLASIRSGAAKGATAVQPEDLENFKPEVDFNTSGRYPDMSVGFADDLVGRGESVPAEFSFRASGGKSIKDGAARIKRLRGNSVVWNQKVAKTYMNKDDILYNIDVIPQNHKFALIRSKAFGNCYYMPSVDVYDYVLTGGEYAKIFVQSNVADAEYSLIYSAAESGYVQLIDLTQMFGAGNEPTTIEEYYARKPIVEDEYAYNEGEVIHMTAKAIKSVGDNAWDEEWEEGNISESTGEDYDSIYAFRSKNVIRVLPNTQYYFKKPIGVVTYLMFYDDMNFVQWLDPFATSGDGGVFTTPNAPYMRFVCYTETYSNDIMITLVHSGWKQDTDAGYQPYWEDRLIFDQRIKEHFPDGMKKWDIAYNKSGKGYIVKGTGVRAFEEGDTEDATVITDGSSTIYELSTPEVIEYDEPFNLDYRVADFGTEEAITDRPSAPIAADIIYQFNAVDMIRELWLKVQELEARLNG